MRNECKIVGSNGTLKLRFKTLKIREKTLKLLILTQSRSLNLFLILFIYTYELKYKIMRYKACKIESLEIKIEDYRYKIKYKKEIDF